MPIPVSTSPPISIRTGASVQTTFSSSSTVAVLVSATSSAASGVASRTIRTLPIRSTFSPVSGLRPVRAVTRIAGRSSVRVTRFGWSNSMVRSSG